MTTSLKKSTKAREPSFGNRKGSAVYKKGQDKAEEILKHGIDLLRKEGPSGFSMRRISQIMDVKISAVQYYYPSRDVLLVAIGRYFEFLYHSKLEAVIDRPFGSPEKRFEAFLDFALDFAEGPTLLFSVLCECQTSCPKMADSIYSCYNRYVGRIVEMLEPLTPNLTAHDRKVRASYIAATIDGLEVFFANDPDIAPRPRGLKRQSRENILKIALDG